MLYFGSDLLLDCSTDNRLPLAYRIPIFLRSRKGIHFNKADNWFFDKYTTSVEEKVCDTNRVKSQTTFKMCHFLLDD